MKRPSIVGSWLLVVSVVCIGSVDAELVSHWTFDGDTLDSGPGGNDGVFVGGDEPLFVDDRDGNPESAILFDGIDDYVLVTHTSGLPIYSEPEFSVAMWVKGGPQPDKRVFSESSSAHNSPLFNLGTQSGGATGQFDLFVRNAAGAASANHVLSQGRPFDDAWHHIAWVDAGGAGRLYIDGALDGTTFNYGRPDLSNGDPAIPIDITTIGGILRAAPCCLFLGAIDEVHVFNHALSAEEIAGLYEPDRQCPVQGDTSCGTLQVSGPAGNEPGRYTLTVIDANDVSGDALSFLFTADDGAGRVLTAGPLPAGEAQFTLGVGTWTLSVEVDDDPLCFDPIATCTTQVVVAPAQQRLIGHWTFDGTLEDDSGNGNDGALSNGLDPTFTADRDGNEEGAILLNGIDELVIVQQNVGLPLYDSPAFSVALWVRGLPQPDFRVWSEASTLTRAPLYNIGTQNLGQTGQVDLYIRGADGVAPVAHRYSQGIAFDDIWHHIAWVDDNGATILYVDGQPDATDFNYVRPLMALNTTTIGGILRDTPSHYFNGAIDDVRAYNYALSAEEVAELVKPASCPELGDTHCDSIVVVGPEGDAAGLWTFTALDADDDGGDPILYTWTATSDGRAPRSAGPIADPNVVLPLSAGTWTVEVTVDDSVFCEDQAPDAVCSTVVVVEGAPGEALSHWPLDGDLEDVLPAANHGAFLGLDEAYVDGVDGAAGGAHAFDGVDDLVQVQYSDGLPLYGHPEFSVAMWVKGLPQNDRRVWSESSSLSNAPLFNIGTESTGMTGQVDIFVRSDAATVVPHRLSTGIAFDGEWHHIAWVDELGYAALYIDGQRDATDFTYTRPEMALDISTIGGILRAATCCLFMGEIDDVRVYSRLLSEEEIVALATVQPPDGGGFLRGDCNSDGSVNIADASFVLNFLFLGGRDPTCMDSNDANDDGAVNIADASFILNFLFLGGRDISAPYPDCGVDPSEDGVDCASFAPCE
jgi:hypothetical protein